MTSSVRKDLYLKVVLTAIALALAILALQRVQELPVARAQSEYSYLYIEPGITTIRTPNGGGEVQGKMVVDLRNGDIWGFPTDTTLPYPVSTFKTEPPVSKPVYLGRFDLAALKPAR